MHFFDDYKEYLLPSIIAIGLHVVLIAWLAMDFTRVDADRHIAPKSIKAKLVQLEQKAPKKAPPKKKKTVKKKPKQTVKPKKTTKPKPKPKKKPKKQTVKKDNKADLEKKRLEQERLKKEQEELAKKHREEEQRQRIQDEDEAAFEDDLLSELDAIEEVQAAEQASADEEAAMSYMGVIQQSVASNWSRPPMARNGMQVSLRIELIPDGTVINVNVVKSSGFDAFDRSAVAAVKKAEQFPELQDLEPRVFNKFYKNFTLIFKPEDLRL